MSESNTVRLHKFIADCGVTSRRKAESLIILRKVKVNGVMCNTLGTKVDPSTDVVEVDGELVDPQSVEKLYILMNKPRCYVTTLSDPEGRRTVMDLCKEVSQRIYPIGRLDYLSEGLLLLTNDGELGNMIMHPKFDVTKVYEVKVFGQVTEGILRKLKGGVTLEDGTVANVKSVRVIKQLPQKTWLEFRLNEGKNREIRRICEACGLTVDKLKRVAIEGLNITGVAPGKFMMLQKRQILEALGLNKKGEKAHETDYFSEKKSVNLTKKGRQKVIKSGTRADSEVFHMFRREKYFDTMKGLKVFAERKEELKKLARKRPSKVKPEPKPSYRS
jgi:23S rRNA pseudouridine2605 synthase